MSAVRIAGQFSGGSRRRRQRCAYPMNVELEPVPAAEKDTSLPFDTSVGYQIRQSHRLLQRYLHLKIEPYGVTPGMWYFLRALWQQDGRTQRELSVAVGTMEPTTLTAIRSMEKGGFVKRVRNSEDRRKINVFLTERGRNLEAELIPLAREVVDTAVQGFSRREKELFLNALNRVQMNLSEPAGDDSSLP